MEDTNYLLDDSYSEEETIENSEQHSLESISDFVSNLQTHCKNNSLFLFNKTNTAEIILNMLFDNKDE